jgi:hypothetical protein
MRPGFNPIRRNRNIGTSRQGHGQDNKLVVPRVCAAERDWPEDLGAHRIIKRSIKGREVTFIVEKTHGGCQHACSVEDIAHVISNIPSDDWRGLKTFVLRQPTQKQRILRPAWGRLCYSANLGLPADGATTRGPAVFIESMNFDTRLEWPSGLKPSDQAELERLRADGHQISRDRQKFVFSMTSESVRVTQLYRTLLHEIGHWLDFLKNVEIPAQAGDGERTKLSEAYFSRPTDEREAFAHRYAQLTKDHLTRFGIIPFTRIPAPPENFASVDGFGDTELDIL